jgi:gliding motility-associated-like protein
MKTPITTIILMILCCASCKKSSDSGYNMSCPANSAATYFRYTQVIGTGVVLPSAFTPNGDGRNDRLRFVGLDSSAVKAMTLRVIDASGATLYTTSDGFKGWDGLNAGKAYATGQYRIEFDGVLSGKGTVADSTVTGHTCVWLLGTTSSGCVQAPSQFIAQLNYVKFEDQYDPATLYAPYTTGENFCP